jgi:hypothetical protein
MGARWSWGGMRLKLVPHPDTPCPALTSVEASVARLAGGGLELHYYAMGRMADIAWPEPAAPERRDRLWEHGCFEAFVGPAGRPGYHEFNFAPSTCWAAYRFNGYRSGMQIANAIRPPMLQPRLTAKTLALRVVLPFANLPGLPDASDWRLALSAVIEMADGAKSYWALAHAPGKPDFHHDDCFALKLPPTGQT